MRPIPGRDENTRPDQSQNFSFRDPNSSDSGSKVWVSDPEPKLVLAFRARQWTDARRSTAGTNHVPKVREDWDELWPKVAFSKSRGKASEVTKS